VQSTMQFGTVAEVVAEVNSRIAAFEPARGFVFAPTHNIQYGNPPENILAAFDTAHNYKTG